MDFIDLVFSPFAVGKAKSPAVLKIKINNSSRSKMYKQQRKREKPIIELTPQWRVYVCVWVKTTIPS